MNKRDEAVLKELRRYDFAVYSELGMGIDRKKLESFLLQKLQEEREWIAAKVGDNFSGLYELESIISIIKSK